MLCKKIVFLPLLLSMALLISTSVLADDRWGGGVEGELPFEYPSEIDWILGEGYHYFDVVVDQNDVVWIATDGVGLLRYDGMSWQHYVIINDIRISWISSVTVDRENNIWFAFEEVVEDAADLPGDWHIAKFDGSEFTTYRCEDAGLGEQHRLRGLTADNDNVIWFIAKPENALISFDGNQWVTHRPEFEGRISNCTITVDSMNRKWFSIFYDEGDGLCCYDGESWTRVDFGEYAQRDGFHIDEIAIDSQDNIWTNASDHTLFKYDGETLEAVLDNHEDESIWCIQRGPMAFDNNGVLWIMGTKPPEIETPAFCLMSYDGSTWEKHFAPEISWLPFYGIAIDSNGTKWILDSKNYSYFTGGHIESGNQTAIDGGEAAPEALAITGVSPNPFNPETAISYVIPDGGHVTVSVYDILGREIARLDDRHMNAGAHTTRWDGRDAEGRLVSSGTYICSVKTASSVATRKMTLMK